MNETIKSEYSLADKIKLAWFLLRTKLINPQIRIVRFPLYIRGKKYIDFGQNLSIGVGCRFDIYPSSLGGKTVKFGKNVQLNDYVHIVGMESITIGDNALMASQIFISDNSHGSYKGDKNDSAPNVAPSSVVMQQHRLKLEIMFG